MDKMLRDKRIIVLFVLPCLLVFALIIPIPLCMAFGLSFTKWNLIGDMRLVGLKNYIRLFTADAIFRRSIGNTVAYLGYSILMQLPLAYILALMLSGHRRLDKFFQNTFYVPVALSASAVSMMFYFIYHADIGVLNGCIRLFVHDFHWAWLAEESTAMIAVCVKVAWQFVGYHMVLYIAGITSISSDLYEAARVDGANAVQTAWYITTPLMKPMFRVSLILITTSSLKSFDSVYVMTGGGPMHATEVMASWMYSQAFHGMKYGYGAAIGVVLFILCVVASLLEGRLLRSDEGVVES